MLISKSILRSTRFVIGIALVCGLAGCQNFAGCYSGAAEVGPQSTETLETKESASATTRATGAGLSIRPDSTVVIVVSPTLLTAVADTQVVKWAKQFDKEDPIVSDPVVAPSSAVYVLTRKHLYGIGSKGETLFDVAHPFSSSDARDVTRFTMIAMSDSTLVLSDGRHEIVKVNTDGTMMWRYEVPARQTLAQLPIGGPNGSIYIRTSLMLYVLDPEGKIRWNLPINQLATSPAE